jgi:hypothetical protein
MPRASGAVRVPSNELQRGRGDFRREPAARTTPLRGAARLATRRFNRCYLNPRAVGPMVPYLCSGAGMQSAAVVPSKKGRQLRRGL